MGPVVLRSRFIDVSPDIREIIETGIAALADGGSPAEPDGLPADWRPEEAATSGMPVVICGHPDSSMVEEAIRRGCGGLLQVATRGCCATVLSRMSRLAECNLLCFSIRSTDLFGNMLAGAITSGLARLAVADREGASLVRTVLDELVKNAIVHGNLGLPSGVLESMDDIDRFNSDIASRLADPAYGMKHVGIGFWRTTAGWTAEIVDDGDGYAFTAAGSPEKLSGNSGYSGRGSQIVRSLSKAVHIDRGGRRTLVRF